MTARLRGLSPVSRDVVWASGSAGTVLRTVDGGRTWQNVSPPDTAALQFRDIEAFDARRAVALSIGEGTDSRVYRTEDGGRTWTVADTPIPAGDPARGVFALAFRDRHRGIAVVGDFRPEQSSPSAGAVSRDGGTTWLPASAPPPAYRSGVTWVPYLPFAAIAVGPSGSDVTYSGGRSWETFDGGSFDTVSCTRDLSCWASGEQGRLARLTVK